MKNTDVDVLSKLAKSLLNELSPETIAIMANNCVQKAVDSYTVQGYIEKAMQPKIYEIVNELLNTNDFVDKIKIKVNERLSAIVEPAVRKIIGKTAEEIAKNK